MKRYSRNGRQMQVPSVWDEHTRIPQNRGKQCFDIFYVNSTASGLLVSALRLVSLTRHCGRYIIPAKQPNGCQPIRNAKNLLTRLDRIQNRHDRSWVDMTLSHRWLLRFIGVLIDYASSSLILDSRNDAITPMVATMYRCSDRPCLKQFDFIQ